MQSPLRAGLLRFLSARPRDVFNIDSLMSTFGQMRLDVDNCLNELVEFGVVTCLPGPPPRYIAQRPERETVAQLLDTFLERRAALSTEDQAPSVQRFREMIGRDEKMLIVFEWIRTAAKSDISVLILGPMGSGKEVVARMIHDLSRREEAERKRVELQNAVDRIILEARPGDRVSLSVSGDTAVYPHDGDTYEALLAKADSGMYSDKSARKIYAARRVVVPVAADASDVAAAETA